MSRLRPLRLFVVAEAQRSGAPIALLRAMTWLVDQGAVEPYFVMRAPGDLLSEFEALGPVRVVPRRREVRLASAARSLHLEAPYGTAKAAGLGGALRRMARAWKTDLVYVNTIVHADTVALLAPLRLPIVCHVHELARMIDRHVSADERAQLISQVTTWLAVSPAVVAALSGLGVPEASIELVPGIVPLPDLPLPDGRAARARMLGGRPAESAVVAACGSANWNKGADLFVPLAVALDGQRARDGAKRPVVACWIGTDEREPDGRLMFEDARASGLGDMLRLLPPGPDASEMLGAADVFASTSREDSNPLTVLEAAAAARPVVCFEGSGGANDLVGAGGGIAVPYLDIGALAAAARSLVEDPDLAARLGARARAYVESHSAAEIVGAHLRDVLRAASA